MYGDDDLSTLYLGSGGGSGGNAVDLSTNPKGNCVPKIDVLRSTILSQTYSKTVSVVS